MSKRLPGELDTVRFSQERAARLGSDMAPPERLGRYVVGGLLGGGGMADVYEAIDEELGRAVAIKLIRRGHDRGLLDKFVEEARIAGQLEHPGIVPVHDVGRAPDGRPYFVMKRIAGRDLRTVLDDHPPDRPVDLLHLLGVFGKVCDAVAFAHAQGVIHRDLKPANVMVGEYGEVLVLDWGVAKIFDSEEAPPGDVERPQSLRPPSRPLPASSDAATIRLKGMGDASLSTGSGAVVGTPAYMAPEQARGEADALGPPSDVYALGAILYRILTGRRPYEGESVDEVLTAVAEGRVIPPSRRRPDRDIPWELEAVALKALALDPEARYFDAAELGADVRRWLEGRPLSAARYSAGQRMILWARRHRKLSAAALLAVVGAVVLAAAMRVEARRERARQTEATLVEVDELIAQNTPEALAGKLRARREALARDATRAFDGPEDHAPTVAAYLRAASLLERAQALAPRNARLRERRLIVGEGLALAAVLSRDFALAAQAAADMTQRGASQARAEALARRVEAERTWLARRRARRLAAMLADLARGLDDPGRTFADWRFDDYLFEAVALRDRHTTRAVSGALDALTRRAEQARESRRAMTWTESERLQAVFCCRVLGQLRGEVAVGALARFAEVLDPRERRLLEEVGHALCSTRNAAAFWPLARLYSRLGNNDPAWRSIRGGLRRVPEPAPNELSFVQRLQRAAMRRLRGDHDGAVADLDAALAASPDNLEVLAQRSLTHLASGDTAAALRDLDRLVELAPTDTEALNNRATIWLRRGEMARARVDLDRALAVQASAPIYLNRAFVREKTGDRTGAIADYGSAIELDPRLVEAWWRRAAARFESRQLADAEADLDRAIRLAPRHYDARELRGRVRQARGDHVGALRDFRELAARYPQRVLPLIRCGEARLAAGDHAGARAELDRAIALDARSARAYFARARVWIALGERGRAEADLGRAIAAKPDYLVAYRRRATLRFKRGAKGLALNDHDALVRLGAEQPARWRARALVDRGRLLADMRRDTEALRDFDAAVRLDASSRDARHHRGMCHGRRGRYAEAIADFEHALEMKETWETHIKLAIALVAANRPEAGRRHAQRALALVPDDQRAEVTRLARKFALIPKK